LTGKVLRIIDAVNVAPKLAFLALDRGPRAGIYDIEMNEPWLQINERMHICVVTYALELLVFTNNVVPNETNLQRAR
jgi:hypothetical protein